MSGDDASKARGNAIAQIEKESREKTGLRSDVVTLYQGGQFHLYRYKRYDDVRLVFAPEEQIAFYGGDPDNFEYPRFDLDVCIFRAYENGQPAKVEHYLKWNAKGPADGELTFVSGHPGRTDRQLTVSDLAELRDQEVPYLLNMYYRREAFLHAWSARSFENKRRAQDGVRGVENNRKRYDGYAAALLDPEIWRSIEQREQKLRDAMNASAEWKGTLAAYDRIKQAQEATAKVLPVYSYFEQFRGRPGASYRAPRAAKAVPTQSISPAPSLCGMTRGKAILRVSPARLLTSEGLTPEVARRTRTSPRSGCGVSSSATRSTLRAAPFVS